MIFKKRSGDKIAAEEINLISKSLNIEPKMAEVLFYRGYKTREAIIKFINPCDNPLHPPLLLSGIQQAAERINKAVNNRETVVIYSDYDADGVCSAGILYRYLLSRGLNAEIYLPSRHSEGYGLHIEAIERLAEEFCPDLIITCDCGISAKDEAEYVMDLGIDIIITDHHEPPEELPQCITVNPKLDKNYPCQSLCGAGVVLKLIQAISGLETALEYVDICAVATIADLVPLEDENRTIAALGIAKLNKNPNKGLGLLINTLGIENITSGEIAFKISPRINAAGRIGDAGRALTMLISDDTAEITDIIGEINKDNDKRKVLCDIIYGEAYNTIKRDDLINERAIILKSDTWEKGIIGIVCARISNEFRRPAFLLSRSGDLYKATARSIDGINIYELLSSLSGCFTEFGGHSQAAGFSIKEEMIPRFAKAVNEYLKEKYDDSFFLPAAVYDAEISKEEMTLRLAGQIELMEPFGQANTRPAFLFNINELNVGYMKNREHLNVNIPDGASMVAFKSGDYKALLKSNTSKKLLIELEVNRYKNNESLKINIRTIGNGVLSDKMSRELIDSQRITQLAYKSKAVKYNKYCDINKVVTDNIYGNYIIADTLESYLRFVNNADPKFFFINEYFSGITYNNYNKVILSPRLNAPLKFYERVIFLDKPISDEYIGYVAGLGCDNIYVPEKESGKPAVELSREVFGKCFSVIKENTGLCAADLYDYIDIISEYNDIKISQLITSILVFSELGIVKINKNPYNIQINPNVKNELTNSRIYNILYKG